MEAQFAYHCMWIRNYELADYWLRLSLAVLPTDEARSYFDIVQQKLAEEAKARAGRH